MKTLIVKVKASQPETKILEQTENEIKLAVSAPAREGRANQEIIKFLSKHFKARVEIVRGKKSRTKIAKVLTAQISE